MRIGIFGGTFDPPHVGHLILAERCREAATLDEVWFLPSYRPPHKRGEPISKFESRCEMVALACAGQPDFKVDPVERELPPPSYTAETLHALVARHPTHTFHLLVGGDSLVDFPGWHRPDRILERASLVAVPRPGVVLPTIAELAAKIGVPESAIRLSVVEAPLVDLSSTDLRRRVAGGQTIRFHTTRAVEEYVREKRLYS